MQGDKKPSRCIPNSEWKRCTEEHNQLFEGFNNYRYSIKIFSITFCTLVTVYCTYKIAKDVFKIVLYVTTFYKQH